MAFARFNLFAMSYVYIFTKAKPGLYRNLEMAGVVFFWTWFGGGVLRSIPGFATRLGFLLVCFAVTSPLHIQVGKDSADTMKAILTAVWQITLSHFAQSTEDLGLYESFPSRQLRTTMDVTCPEWIEWIHGGLHMQVTHHVRNTISELDKPCSSTSFAAVSSHTTTQSPQSIPAGSGVCARARSRVSHLPLHRGQRAGTERTKGCGGSSAFVGQGRWRPSSWGVRPPLKEHKHSTLDVH